MPEVTLSKRWLPLWVGIALGVPLLGGFAGVVLAIRDGSASLRQLPLFAVFIYLWLIVLLNRTTIRIHPAGVRILTGPLPSGFEREVYVPRAEVSRILVRNQPGPKGSTQYFATVEREPGAAWIDLLGGFWYQREAQNIAEQVARVWAWPHPLALERGVPLNRRAGWVVVGWGLAVALALAWGVFVEGYRF